MQGVRLGERNQIGAGLRQAEKEEGGISQVQLEREEECARSKG